MTKLWHGSTTSHNLTIFGISSSDNKIKLTILFNVVSETEDTQNDSAVDNVWMWRIKRDTIYEYTKPLPKVRGYCNSSKETEQVAHV